MGKYFRKVEGSVSLEEIDIIVKYYIANELAEANRLKRIKMKRQDKININNNYVAYVGSLEDQA